jgi:gamma-glutamyltranspeptidase/glutathione hydrolase
MPDGSLPAEGDRLKLPDLAATLYLIAADGPKAFYSGTIADKITAGVQKYGGLITNDDLESYRASWRDPIKFTFDSLDVYSMPPPSSGGILVGQILKLLEPYGFGSFSPESPEYIHLFCEAARLAYADRSRHLGDPDFWNVPSKLLDDDYLKERRAKISFDHAGTSIEVEPGSPARFEPEHTTHYSICDARGNMVSVTTTINSYFGGGLAVEGAGFLLNNEMDDFSIKTGHANLYGLTGSEANRIEPGKRMLSSMAPTLVLKHDRPYLILGSPGGSKIPTTVAQAILDVTRFGLTLEETVNQPRFHHQWLPDILYLEAGRFDVAVKQRLIRYGHQIEEREPIGDLEIVEIDPVTGLMSGASDPRRGGAVDGL